MRALLQSYPPLGQVTCVQDGQVNVTVVLDVSNNRRHEPWEVALWHSVDGGVWSDKTLLNVDATAAPHVLQHTPASSAFLYFSVSVSFQTSVQFTLKFREENSKPWKWVHDEEGLNDGIILLGRRQSESNDIRDYIPDLDARWKISNPISQSPGTQLWSIQSEISAATGQDSYFEKVSLGTPWLSYIRWFALVRHRPAWLGPRQGSDYFSVDQDALLCTFLSHQGRNIALLGLNGLENVSTAFRHTEDGGISVLARNDDKFPRTATVLVSEGADVEHAIAAVVYHARTLVSRQLGQTQPHSEPTFPSDPASQLAFGWLDGLGFCTWNSLGQSLSEKKVLDALEKLAKHNIHISNLIIDDNWQSLDRIGNDPPRSGLGAFEADREAFPNGLKSLVSRIREIHPDIRHISVWHAMLGYWGGISPKGAIAKTYKTVEVAQNDPNQPSITVVAKEDVAKFYDDFYQFLRDSGIDGAKTDAQVMLDLLSAAGDRRDLISKYLDTWDSVSEKHFSKKCTSCMSQFPQALFHSQLPRNKSDMPVRNSDDYFPDVPDSHPWHLWANAHNAIFTQFLNVIPDWDMFQSAHEYGGYHAAARCVSGGPIHLTDVPGEHDLDLISQITAPSPSGQTMILRPTNAGKATSPYTGFDDDILLKVGGYNGGSSNGTGILGVFNVSGRRLTEMIPLTSFPGTLSDTKYIVRAHTTGRVSAPMGTDSSLPLIAASLDVAGFEVLCAFPLTPFKSKSCENGLGYAAALGLIGKMTGCAATTQSTITQRDNGKVVIAAQLKALGVLGIYISSFPRVDIDQELMAALDDQPLSREMVRRSKDDEHVFEIDVEKAWKQIGQGRGTRSLVSVKVYFSA